MALCLKKVCYKVSLCENCQRQILRKAFIGLTIRAKMIGEGNPSTWNFGSRSNWPHWSNIADFRSIFTRSASAVTPSDKSSIKTNGKSTTRFPISLRWSSYVAPKPPAQKRKTAVFDVKSHFAWKKSATKFLCVKTVSDKYYVRHSLA